MQISEIKVLSESKKKFTLKEYKTQVLQSSTLQTYKNKVFEKTRKKNNITINGNKAVNGDQPH